MAQRDLTRGRSFDAVSRAYDRFRPHYPDEIFEAIDQCVDLRHRRRILEVGCGTGQATEELLARGCHVHAVEPGVSLANVASEKFKRRDFDVDLVTFEEFQPRGRHYDVVFSATAFHWIDPAMRWKKAAETLKEDGFIVLVTNHTLDGASFNRFYDAAQDLLATYRSDDDVTPPPTEKEMVNSLHDARGDIGALWEVVEPQGSDVVAGELFRVPDVHWHRWQARYSTEDALGLLSTYSNYLALSASAATTSSRRWVASSRLTLAESSCATTSALSRWPRRRDGVGKRGSLVFVVKGVATVARACGRRRRCP